MRATRPSALTVAALASAAVVGCAGASVHSAPAASDGGRDAPSYVLPPVIDASFGPDSFETRDRISFPCGTLTGAVAASLLCNRLYPDLNWDFEPDYAFVSIAAT